MPTATHSAEAVATVTPDQAWSRLQSPDPWASVGGVKQVWDVVHDETGNLSSYHFRAEAAGRLFDGTTKVFEIAEPSRMSLAIITNEVEGSITAELHEHADGTLVGVTVSLASRGLLASMFFGVISNAVANGLPREVKEFASSLSTDSQ